MPDLFDMIFGCWHKNFTRPMTPRGTKSTPAALVTGTYVCCLDCGKEFPYSLEDMAIVVGHNHEIAELQRIYSR
jgi:hypothetical protein